jgi:Mg-chelatase subunit ChlD
MTPKEENIMSQTTPVHISIVLDRSGSMSSIADDIVGGFNHFLKEQREQSGEARVTLVQFDGQDPFEVLIDGDDLSTVEDLDARRYQPRGNTPLLDAVGSMIARIDAEIVARADEGLPIEDQVVVIITDGYENASTEFSGQMISDLVAARRERAWTFVFLGADEASIRDSVAIGVASPNTSRWEASKGGTKQMYSRLSNETAKFRAMDPAERRLKSERFFEDEGEDDSK